MVDLTIDERLDAACAAAGTRISRVHSSTVSEMHTPRTTASCDGSAVGDTPSARRAHRGDSQMSPREVALAPVVTPEHLMASLEDLEAEFGPPSGDRTPVAAPTAA